jgi:hypothetical protein
LVSFPTFCRWVESMLERLPPRWLEELHGGVQVERQACRRPEDPPGVYRLGEYLTDPYLGRMIRIYYGSFRQVMGGEPREVVRRELWETLLHELRHHLEDLAGVDLLDREDQEELARLWHEVLREESGP